MKLFVVCNYLGGGGAERVAVNLANGLSQRNYEVYIIADLVRYRSYEVDENITQLSLHSPDIPNYLKAIQGIKNIRKYAKQYHPDLIITVMHFCSLFAKTGTLGMGIPIIQTIHHPLESKAYKLHPIAKFLDKHTSPLYAHTTVLTKADIEFLGNYGKRVSVMPNPLSFTPVDHLPIKEKIIFSAGRLDNWHYKGWDILIKTIHEIKEYMFNNNWRLLLAGTGRDESIKFLEDMCKDYGVEKLVDFVGFRRDVIDYFRKSSIFFLSSRAEGLPMVLIEAMSQGCACVATDFKGRTREILTNDETGLLAEPEDYKTLAKHLKLVMDDDNLRVRMQQNAIERSKYYKLDNIVDMWESLIKKVVSEYNIKK